MVGRVGRDEAAGGVLQLPVGRLVGGREEEARVEDLVDLDVGSGTVPVALRLLGDRAHDVVDGLAVAELGREPRLEADEVAQPVGQPALEEGRELAVGDASTCSASPASGGSTVGSRMTAVGVHLEVRELDQYGLGRPPAS